MKKNVTNHSIEPSRYDVELELIDELYEKACDYHTAVFNENAHLSNQLRNTISIVPIFLAGFIATAPYLWEYSPFHAVLSIISIASIGISLLIATMPLIKRFIPFMNKIHPATCFDVPNDIFLTLRADYIDKYPPIWSKLYLKRALAANVQDSNKKCDKYSAMVNKFISYSSLFLFISIFVFAINISSYFISGGRLWETKTKKIPITTIVRQSLISNQFPTIEAKN